MRKVLLFFVVAIVLLVVLGDFVVKAMAERAVASELTSAAELDETPEVGIDAFPFITSFFGGRFESMTVETTDVQAGVLNLAEVTLTLDEMAFEPSDVLRGDVESIETAGGTGVAVLTEEDLNESLAEEGSPATAELIDGGVSLAVGDATLEGSLSIDDDVLTVTGPSRFGSVNFQLPTLGGHVTYESFEIRAGRAEMKLSAPPGELRRPD